MIWGLTYVIIAFARAFHEICPTAMQDLKTHSRRISQLSRIGWKQDKRLIIYPSIQVDFRGIRKSL